MLWLRPAPSWRASRLLRQPEPEPKMPRRLSQKPRPRPPPSSTSPRRRDIFALALALSQPFHLHRYMPGVVLVLVYPCLAWPVCPSISNPSICHLIPTPPLELQESSGPTRPSISAPLLLLTPDLDPLCWWLCLGSCGSCNFDSGGRSSCPARGGDDPRLPLCPRYSTPKLTGNCVWS